MNRFLIRAAIVAVSLFVTVNYATAHKSATGVVKERMMAMEAIGKSMKQLAAMIRGKQPYDVNQVKKNALIIKQHGGESLINFFPKNSIDKPSEARPTIWENWDHFSALAIRLSETAGALAVAADNDASHVNNGEMMNGRSGMMSAGQFGPSAEQLSSMPPQASFMHMAQTCKSCHKSFRQKK